MKILVLAGTAEARELCAVLQERGHEIIASLAGATRKPLPLGVTTRVGGFGGVKGLQDYVEGNGIDVLLDATHPFAHRMSANAASIRGVEHAILQRPEWQPIEGDQWVEIGSATEAAEHVTAGQVVFLATGRQTIEDYACLNHAYVYARVLDKPSDPYPHHGEYLWGRPPFPVEDEVALFRDLNVDWLVVKNAGGESSFSKIRAARDLNLPVLMIRRPALPKARVFETVHATTDWIESLG